MISGGVEDLEYKTKVPIAGD